MRAARMDMPLNFRVRSKGPRIPVLGIVIVLAAMLTCARGSDTASVSGRAMGTTWLVRYVPPAHPLAPEHVERAVSARLGELEALFSTYRRDSALSRFNAIDHTDWVPVAGELAQVAQQCQEISALTGGAFDVTVQPLVRLWGFGPERRSGDLPSAAEIGAAQSLVGWRELDVRLNPPALRKKKPRLAVDLSSMAKGFAADSISAVLHGLGATEHWVQVGGDIRTTPRMGASPGWRAAIERPVADAGRVGCVVALNGQALSTSGNYRNFFQVGGRRFGHIIDPRSGEPVSQALAAVSVVDASCATSSAWATALFVLGPEEGFRLARSRGLACLFILREGDALTERATPEFERLRKD